MTRLLLTADALGGAWTWALELASTGSRALLAVVGPGPDAGQRAEAAAVPGLDLAVTGLPLEWRDREGPLAPAQARALLDLERAFAPDVVHCGGYREAAAGFASPVALTAHSCVATWARACKGTGLPDGWAAYERGLREGLAAAGAAVFPTQAFRAAFEAEWGRVARGVVIRNGVGGEERCRPAAPSRCAVLAAGRFWDEAKNLAVLAKAAEGLPWPVELAGEGEAPRGANLRPLGRLARADLRARMARAAVFAHPARYEPFGLAPLEAAQAGCALVLSDIPTLRELWQGAALFADPIDPAAWRAALLRLIESPDERARLARAARERARLYGRGAFAKAHLSLWDSLTGERRAPAEAVA